MSQAVEQFSREMKPDGCSFYCVRPASLRLFQYREIFPAAVRRFLRATVHAPSANQGRKARANRVRGKAAPDGLGYAQHPISAPPDPRPKSQPKGGLRPPTAVGVLDAAPALPVGVLAAALSPPLMMI